VRIVTLPPDNGFVMPDTEQLRSLRRIVVNAYPGLNLTDELEAEAEFERAFRSQGRFFRTESPIENRAFEGFLDEANAKLTDEGLPAIGGRMFLAACLAAGDIVWRRRDGSAGQLLTLGLHSYQGLRCNNRWLAIASGTGDLLEPMPPRGESLRRPYPIPQPKFYRQTSIGERLLGEDEMLWSRR
jgi:hypothetical protein